MPRGEGGWIRRSDGDKRHPPGSLWRAMVDDLVQDLRFGVHGLTRNPGFTTASVITIAIGIGATTAIVSVANAVLLRPLPVAEPDRLAAIWESRTGAVLGSLERSMVPYERYEAYEEATRDVFTSLAAHRETELSLRAEGEAEALSASLTSANYFQVLGLRPAAGRFYAEDGETAVVLSERFWRREFGGDRSVIGRTVHVDSRPFTIAGVAPADFAGVRWRSSVDLWVPMADFLRLTGSSGFGSWVLPFGRLAPGMDRARAEQQVASVARAIPPDESHTRVQGAHLEPPVMKGDERAYLTRFLGMFLVTALLVLLIASANVVGMLLARGVGRRREFAVRLATGARPGRLVRQLLAENVLLFLIGGVGGALIAIWATRPLPGLIRLLTADDNILDFTPDLRVLAVGLGLAAGIGILFGLGPALRAARLDVVAALKEGPTLSGGRTGRRRSSFVLTQVAMTALLLVTAGLFVRSVRQGQNVDVGFDADGVVVSTTNLGPHGYDPERGRVFYDQLAERVRGIPGVESVALANRVLLGGDNFGNDVEAAEPGAAGRTRINALWNTIDTAYFQTMRIELVAGRAFTAEDRAGGPPVVVVNETLARRLWPGESAVGKRLREGRNIFEVIGVTRDGKYATVTEEPRPFAFLPLAQHYRSTIALHVRAPAMSSETLEHIRREVRGLDPNVAVQHARVLARVVEASLFDQRFAAALTGLFGLLGLVLAAIGVYGVLAMHVAQRSREFGIRMALGAHRADVLRSVLARGAVLAAVGAAVGLVLASAVTRLLHSFLFGVSPLDPIAFTVVASLLIGVALLASFVPARRATTADPLAVLRQE